ncbi:MAG: hypothetical protein RQ885_14040 [Desulfurococcales archaeon]|jgi:uncharacterized membrane protein|nr:hypothetical protein [Desulfurococcales archaeon]
MDRGSIEKTVYTILRSSVILSIVLILIGIGSIFLSSFITGYMIRDSELSFKGLTINKALERLSSGDPVSILWIATITLVTGVISSVAISAYRAYRLGDKPLAAVSTALILIVLLSAIIGIIVRSPR